MGRAAIAILLGLVLAAAGCGPAPSTLSDPREILDRAAEQLGAAETVHLEVTVDGNLAIGSILGAPGASGSVGLAGTHMAGDLDIGRDRVAATFEVPALLGLRGELRQIGADAYLRSSLTERGWHHLDAGALPLGVARPLAWLDALAAWLDRPGTVPSRLNDAACPAGTCYAVRLVMTAAELGAGASAAPGVVSALGDATLRLEVKVDRSSLDISAATIEIDLAEGGSVTVALVFSAWDAPVSIEPPPASEIVEGPLLP